MSAFIVSHNLIDVLLTFAIDKRVSYYVKTQNTCISICRQNATEVGAILLQENERSVYCRYPDIGPKSENKPGTQGEVAETYLFHRWGEFISAVSILKACSCFDYQACETDDYEHTLACTIIEAIRHAAIRAVPGYDNVPGWDDFTRPKARNAG